MFLRFVAVSILGIFAAYFGCSTNGSNPTGAQEKRGEAAGNEYSRLRAGMVNEQLRSRGILDTRVLSAMAKVPRHQFVPSAIRSSAYKDSALPLTHGQTISQPYIVAYMTEALRLRGTERVLEIGTGSGYQAAVLAEIVPEVFTVEIVPELAARAGTVLQQLGYRNVRIRTGDGYLGWPEFSPFDAIIVTAAPDHVPQPLVDQLKPGGRMVIPVGTVEQQMMIIEKGPSGVISRSTIPVRFVPMTGKARE